MDSQKLRISGIVDESIVDGRGIRYVIFTQGCPHHCPGCHNPHTHDFTGGTEVTLAHLLQEIKENPLLRGVTFSGGEPFCQPEALLALAKEIHKTRLDITAYTGYTLEELQTNPNPAVQDLLNEIDVLIDGKFIETQKDLTLRFRGSTNQRMIDMKATRERGELVLIE